MSEAVIDPRVRYRELDEQEADLEERAAEIDDELAHYARRNLEAEALAYGLPTPPGLDDLRAERVRVAKTLVDIGKAKQLLRRDIDRLVAAEREEEIRIAIPDYEAAVARKLRALVEAAKAGWEAEQIRGRFTSYRGSVSRMRPLILHGIDPRISVRDNLSILCYALREAVAHGIVRGSEEWLDGVAWREAGVTVKAPRHVQTGPIQVYPNPR
jgi:hypothetical protein